MKKALVTGGAGFIGYHLIVKLLDQGYQVHALDNFKRGVEDSFLLELKQKKNFELINIDLLNEKATMELDKDYDVIFHFAALLGVQNVINNPYNVLALNNKMLTNIISLGKIQKSLKRMVFTSTSEVYAGTLRYHGLNFPTAEDTTLTVNKLEEPRTSYMLSKIYGEALCIHSGLPYTIVRPHNIYGPRMGLSHVIPELLFKVHNMNKDEELEVFSVDHQRTFCYIDDAINLILYSSESVKGRNKILNVGVESPEVKIGELAKIIIKTVGKNVNIKAIQPTPGSPVRRCPSIKNIEEITQYSPNISLEDGIRKTYSWYKDNVFDSDGISAK